MLSEESMELTVATPFLAFTLFLFLDTAILKLKHESKPTQIKSSDALKIFNLFKAEVSASYSS